MKKVIHVIIIVLILISFCVVEQVVIHSYLFEIESKITEINNNPSYETITKENQKELLTNINNLSMDWAKKDDILCLFVNHNNIDEIGIELIKAKNAVQQNDISTFKESLNLILFYIDGYKQTFFIKFRTIF